MNILVARTSEDIESACRKLSTAGELGCDTETSGFSARFGRIFSVQFSDGETNVLVPLSEGVPLGPFGEILEDPGVVKIFHNARFDLEFLREAGHQVNNVFDTMIAEKVLTRGANQSASLAETLYRYFAVDLEKSHRQVFSKKWDGIWTDALVEYALSDVVHLPRLKREQERWMERLGLTGDFETAMAKIV
jgi:ribonuclease D